jgi:hypothetical protein
VRHTDFVGPVLYDAHVNDSDQLRPLTDVLSSQDAVLGAVAFGSLTRGELTQSSDVDILVVHRPEATVRHLRATVLSHRQTPGSHRWTPIYFTPDELAHEFSEHPSFAAHIADEGVTVYRTADFAPVEQRIRSPKLTTADLHAELQLRLQPLRWFANLKRFNGRFIQPLSHLYSIGKSIVIVKLLESGVREYSWRRIFGAYVEIRPDLEEEIRLVETLREHYEYFNNLNNPLEPKDTSDIEFVRRAVRSITTVASS